MRRSLAAVSLLGLAAVAYTLAAFAVTPGFYDGFGPPPVYNWVSPPPGITNPGPPASGHCTVQIRGGTVEPGTCFTDDGQAVLSYIPGAFAVPSGGGPLKIDIVPVASYPTISGFKAGTNVYRISANSSVAKEVTIILTYSNLIPAPGFIYVAATDAGPWTKIGASGVSAPFTISQKTTTLGYVVAGSTGASGAAKAPTVGGGQALPIIVAAVIVLVILAGIPLALLRRRTGDDEEPESSE